MNLVLRSLPVLSAIVLFLTNSTAHAANVLKVGPGQTYTTLQSAANAAANGDVLLVMSNAATANANISGKALTIVRDGGVMMFFSGQIIIQDLPLGSTFTLSGIRCLEVLVRNCAGAVRIQDCFIRDGAFVEMSSDVWISNSEVRGRMPLAGQQVAGGTAVSVTHSTVALDHCLLVGSNGLYGTLTEFFINVTGGAGGHGLYMTDSTAFISGCTLRGGNAGNGANGTCGHPSFPPTSGGNGGDGLVLIGSSQAQLLDNTFTTGTAGTAGPVSGGGSCTPTNGSPGTQVNAAAGAATFLPGDARRLAPVGAAREGSSIQLNVEGQPGDVVVLAVSEQTAHQSVPGHGVLGIALPARRVTLGTIGLGGTLSTSLPAPELGFGVLERRFQTQIVCVDTSSNAWFGTPMTVTLLDSSL